MRIKEFLTEELTKKNIKKVLTPEVRKLGHIFEKNGHELRIVGGAVRDLLLGKMPKDIDFASDATPEEMISFLEDAGYRVIPTGLDHGTISVVGEHDEPYEITTLRIDTEHTGRHATVEYTRDFKKDAERRDLTFNAMSIDMNGKVYDYFGGIQDLRNHKARFVGDPNERIQEDYLRILRYFRFQGRMHQADLDDETKQAIKNNASGLEQISGERIWQEMSKILVGNHVEHLINEMCELDVAQYISLPCNNVNSVDTIVSNTDNPITVLAHLTETEDEVGRIIEHWKLSNPEKKLLNFLVENKKSNIDIVDAKKMISNGISREYVYELLNLQNDDATARQIRAWNQPKFPINGQDLKDLGYKPGPEFGEILKYLKSTWQESGYELSREELLGMLENNNVENY